MTNSTLTEAELDLRQKALLTFLRILVQGIIPISLSTNVLMTGSVNNHQLMGLSVITKHTILLNK